MFKKDFIERQIETISNTFAAILFGKEKVKSILSEENEKEQDSTTAMEDEILERMVKKYIKDMDFNKAEDILFNSIEANKTAQKLEIALLFYNEVNKYSDDILKKYGFSKEDITNGVNQLKAYYE